MADLRAGKGRRKFTQVTANTAEEAAAAAEAGLDMIIGNSQNVADIRAGNDTLFLTAALGLPNFPTESDILREAFRVLALGADAVMTARGMSIVSLLAKEDIPVMGHLGLVPRKSSWVGGLRAVGKTADEAFDQPFGEPIRRQVFQAQRFGAAAEGPHPASPERLVEGQGADKRWQTGAQAGGGRAGAAMVDHRADMPEQGFMGRLRSHAPYPAP